ncbi:hypothetical protein ABZ468_40520 [Streptomyces sp. NPDC005708]|uniref:hypothetical protein n=1 Tax=Streptomyces sp. NPDC005708 TaxID=3154564 RepID=UPI0033E89E3C
MLCEFRARLVAGDAAERVLNLMLRRLVEAGLLAARGRQRTDATHVLAAVRRVSRLELVGESMRAALEELARQDAGWLAPLIEPGWDKRYGHRVEIRKVPGGAAGVVALAETFGNDGRRLLTALWEPGAPPRLRRLRQVEILRQVWTHHFYWNATGSLRWRDGHELPPASLRFDSPYDTDAHYCVKNGTKWSGYRAHFTEACDPDLPEVVVHAAATIAPVQDGTLLDQIHADLADLHLLPGEHLVDAAYPTRARIAHAWQAHGVTLTGPLPTGSGRKAPPDPAFGKAAFAADWDTHQLTCPTGQTSLPWKTLTLRCTREVSTAGIPATSTQDDPRPGAPRRVLGSGNAHRRETWHRAPAHSHACIHPTPCTRARRRGHLLVAPDGTPTREEKLDCDSRRSGTTRSPANAPLHHAGSAKPWNCAARASGAGSVAGRPAQVSTREWETAPKATDRTRRGGTLRHRRPLGVVHTRAVGSGWTGPAARGFRCDQALRAWISSVRRGTTSNRSPTTP